MTGIWAANEGKIDWGGVLGKAPLKPDGPTLPIASLLGSLLEFSHFYIMGLSKGNPKKELQ